MCGSPSWQRADKNIHRKSDWACVGKSRPTLDMFRSRYSFIKAKRINGSKVMQRRAMFSKAKQCKVMQNKCLKTGTAWFWRTSVLVYLYFLVVHITELNLLRALSWMAGGFNWLGKAYCLQLMVWNAAFCESTTPFCSGVFVLIWLLASAFVASGSGYWTLELIL